MSVVERRADAHLQRKRALKFVASFEGSKFFVKAISDLAAMYANPADELLAISYYESLDKLLLGASQAMCLEWIERYMSFKELKCMEKRLQQEEQEGN